MKCKRGDIWWVNFNPARGSEQAGKRPALIVQNDIGNKYANTTIVVAVSSKVSVYPQNVILMPTKTNGLSQKSCVKCGQVLTLTQCRLVQKIGKVSDESLAEVNQALSLSMGLV